MNTRLKQDYRDVHVVGSVDFIPDEIEFDRGLTNIIESASDVDCTAISATDVATDQVGTIFNILDLWALTPHGAQGADPRESMGALVKYGLQPTNGGPRDTRWKGYVRSDGTSGDYGLTVQNSMISLQSSTTVASNYYQEWTNTPEGGVLPVGKTLVSGHDYKISGWRTVDGQVQFHVKFWTGGFKWMPKGIFNIEMDKYGTGAYIPTTTEILIQSEKTLMNFIKSLWDSIINLSLKLQQPTMPTTPVIVSMPTFTTMITKWAGIIKIQEGNAPSLNNPGSLKVSPLTISWGAKNGVQASDGGWIAKFDTYNQGFTALCNFLTLGCHDELKAFHQARTLESFTKIYAGNPPSGYIHGIIQGMGVPGTTDISTFLS